LKIPTSLQTCRIVLPIMLLGVCGSLAAEAQP
jgi:hypothetical protein